ncbi:MAG: hypothetical protein ACLGIO_09075 [Acidimicrobiia bacterium]
MRRAGPRALHRVLTRRERRALDRVALQPQRWPRRPTVRLVGPQPYDWSRPPP